MKHAARFILRIGISSTALYAAGKYLDGVVVSGDLQTIIWAGILLAVFNTFLKPLLKLISIPLIWMTFGLFTIVIHMVLIALVDYVIPGITIHGVAPLFFTSLIIGIANMVI